MNILIKTRYILFYCIFISSVSMPKSLVDVIAKSTTEASRLEACSSHPTHKWMHTERRRYKVYCRRPVGGIVTASFDVPDNVDLRTHVCTNNGYERVTEKIIRYGWYRVYCQRPRAGIEERTFDVPDNPHLRSTICENNGYVRITERIIGYGLYRVYCRKAKDGYEEKMFDTGWDSAVREKVCINNGYNIFQTEKEYYRVTCTDNKPTQKRPPIVRRTFARSTIVKTSFGKCTDNSPISSSKTTKCDLVKGNAHSEARTYCSTAGGIKGIFYPVCRTSGSGPYSCTAKGTVTCKAKGGK